MSRAEDQPDGVFFIAFLFFLFSRYGPFTVFREPLSFLPELKFYNY